MTYYYLDVPGEFMRRWNGPLLPPGTEIRLDDEQRWRTVDVVRVMCTRGDQDGAPVEPEKIVMRVSERVEPVSLRRVPRLRAAMSGLRHDHPQGTVCGESCPAI